MTLDAWLLNELEHDRNVGLERHLSEIPAGILSFSTNDYLGLSSRPELREAAEKTLADAPIGACASRLVSGHTRHHRLLEESLASFKRTARALTFPTGYAAATGTIPVLTGPGDTVVLDKLSHACLLDAAKLSGATVRVFEHNQPGALEDILRWTREKDARGKILIIAESVHSMDGDTAPLQALCDLKDSYGAWLMIDEAHATGVFGSEGRGLCNEPGVAGRVEIQMGTLGKALGTAGGFIAGSDALIDLLIHRARSFLFTTAAPPALAAAATAAIALCRGKTGHDLRLRLAVLLEHFHHLAPHLPIQSPIIPVLIGDASAATARSAGLLEKGFHVPAIRYPTVPQGTARLRISINATHREEDLNGLATAIQAT
jgi:8-amino-7-oxononanoate synthase